MKKLIYPCLWFDENAKEAAEFYCSVFNKSSITSENDMVVTFETYGQKFMCLNGGSQFSFNPSISFFVLCESEDEINNLWRSFSENGLVLMPLDKHDWSERYGWVQDRFGVSWQLSLGKIEDTGQKISPVLMFTGEHNGKVQQAIHYYTSIFEGSSIKGILKYSGEDNDTEGNVKHAQFTLGEQVFMSMDSSQMHQSGFNEAISFVVECDTQNEIDFYWNKLTESGEEGQCGWLKDKYGISWQIIPAILEELMNDESRSERVINAFLKMKKFEIEKLVNA